MGGFEGADREPIARAGGKTCACCPVVQRRRRKLEGGEARGMPKAAESFPQRGARLLQDPYKIPYYKILYQIFAPVLYQIFVENSVMPNKNKNLRSCTKYSWKTFSNGCFSTDLSTHPITDIKLSE
jgi:hypothetical protein